MADQYEQIAGAVLTHRVIRGEWGIFEIETDDGGVTKCTGDIAHLSTGDRVTVLGRWRTTKWGTEFTARVALPVELLPTLQQIEAVVDRFDRRPARGAVLGLVIRLGRDAAATMERDPFLPVVSAEHQVRGWGYGSAAKYADLVEIPADDTRRATAAVIHMWPQLADGSVVVSRDRLESRISAAAGIDETAASKWVDTVIADGRLEYHGPKEVCWRDDARAERNIAKLLKERLAA